MNTFCTITGPAYLPFVKALYRSLQQQAPGCLLHVLVTGNEELPADTFSSGMKIDRLQDLAAMDMAAAIESKYGGAGDSLRWAVKPVYMSYLLQRYEKVIYTDCDIYYAADPSFLFEELNGHSILLSPHWGTTDPKISEENFLLNFRIGMYNAGFIGATTPGLPSLQWWAEACLFDTSRQTDKGLFYDQRYLDLLPVIDEKAKILRHRGCNLGSWNIDNNKRSLSGGKVMINGEYPVVFVHFNKETIHQVLNRNDELLRPYLDDYTSLLAANGFDLYKNYQELPEKQYDSAAYKAKHKLRLRTRFKRFFYRLAEKL